MRRQGGNAPSIGPLTDAALAKRRRGRPPAFIEEFHAKLKEPGDFILLWAGAFKGAGTTTGSWSSLSVALGGAPPGSEQAAPQVMEAPASHVERLLAPLAHGARIGILQLLYGGPRTSGELTELTGLKGGNLHYHLKELAYAHYVEQKEGRYGLTGLGSQMLITVACIASVYVKDRGDEGLEILGGWSDGGG